MGPAPVQIDQVFIGDVVITPAKEQANALGITVAATPTYRRSDADPLQWLVTLDVTFAGADGKIANYSGRVEATGHFTVLKNVAADKVNKIVAVTCASILYSTVREIVATISGRGTHGVFILPTVSFTDHDLEIAPPAAVSPGKIEGRT